MFGVMSMAAACVTQDDLGSAESESKQKIKNGREFKNELGTSATFSTAGFVSMDTAFNQDLGSNGRDCGSCHNPAAGWTVSPDDVQKTFDRTKGRDPIFRTNDGSNSPTADVSSKEKRRKAYSMLLSRGVIRVGLPMPAGADFQLIAVDDPYHFASAAELSLFRRPLPSANLKFIPQVMWDGRVSFPVLGAITDAQRLAHLAAQSNGATQGHAQAPDPIEQSVRDEIVGFEMGLLNAQTRVGNTHDHRDDDGDDADDDDDDEDSDGGCDGRQAGNTSAEGALGGPEALVAQLPVNTSVAGGRWNLFDSWQNSTNEARRAVFRGQELFNNRARIVNPANPTAPPAGQCRFCHSMQNVGANFAGTFFSVQGRGAEAQSDASRRQADQPLYTFKNTATGVTTQITDPGRALITGKFADIGKFKVPNLRALGSRAPYFHGGSAKTLLDVVRHYEVALAFEFTPDEEKDLVAFLSAL
jgi:cytochrome c peroxidase